MIRALRTKNKEDLLNSNNFLECQCIHCEKIREQQLESETRWVRLHQLFDRYS